MNLFLEADGKIFVAGKDPLRCPECRRVFACPKKLEATLRCPFCEYHGEKQEFKFEYADLGTVRVLVPV